MSLDPDDPRPPYQQVASSLRASILTGQFAPGEKLPSQAQLSASYGVARMTIQQALRILKDEGLTYSRQGSGVFARERTSKPVGLRPHIEAAMETGEVALDFAGYTAETLSGVLAEPLDKIRSGRLAPHSVRLRLLLPDLDAPLPVPSASSGQESDNIAVRQRMRGIAQRSIQTIAEAVRELADLGLIQSGSVEIRTFANSPAFKTYIVNGTDVFFAFYPVTARTVRIGEESHPILDAMGKDAALFQYTDDGDPASMGAQFVHETRHWFESTWEHLGVEGKP